MTSTTSATTANTTVPTPFSCPFSAGWRGRRDSSNSANCSKYSIFALASSCSRRIYSSRRACSPLGSRMQSKYSCPGANRCTGSVRCCFLRYSFITPKLQLFPQNPTTLTPLKKHHPKILPPTNPMPFSIEVRGSINNRTLLLFCYFLYKFAK